MPEAGLRGPGRPKGSLNRKGTKTRPGPAAIKAAAATAAKAARAALRPRKSKVTTRGLDPSGIPASHRRNNLNHTSFRLDERSRVKLRQLAKRTFGGTTMSAVLRLLIDEAWAREFAKGQTRKVGKSVPETTVGAAVAIAGSRFRLLSQVPDSEGGVDWYDAADPDILRQVLRKERADRTFLGNAAEGVRVAQELRAAGLLPLPPLTYYDLAYSGEGSGEDLPDRGYYEGDL